jgi:hypothetical protein
MRRFLKRAAFNRLGLILCVVHLLLVVYFFGQKIPVIVEPPCFIRPTAAGVVWAGRDFFFASEPAPLKVVVILDSPGLFLANLIRFNLFPQNMCPYTQSWWYAGFSLLFTSIQWLLVGFLITFVLQRLKTKLGNGRSSAATPKRIKNWCDASWQRDEKLKRKPAHNSVLN